MFKNLPTPPATQEEIDNQRSSTDAWNAYDDGCWRDDGPSMPKPKKESGPADWAAIQAIADSIKEHFKKEREKI